MNFQVISIGLIVLLLSTSLTVATAQSANTSIVINVTDSQTIYTTPALDVCATVHLGSCAVYLTVKESYSQNIPTTMTVDKPVLQAGDTTTLSITANPSAPASSMDFIFTFGSKSYIYTYQLTSLQSIGSGTAISIPIPIGALTAALGLPPLPITLNVDGQISSTLTTQVQSIGFSGSPGLSWSAPGVQTGQLTFSGNAETSQLSLSPSSLQDWILSVSAGVPLVGKVQLYSSTVNKLAFKANAVNAFTWHHISVSSQYSQATGSGWYLSGNQATISVADNIVSVSDGERRAFTGWQGSGSNSYSGPVQTQTLVVNGPVNETAQWKTQYQVVITQASGGTTNPAAGAQWYDSGYQLTLQANPDGAHQFKDWLVNGQVVSTSSTYTLAVQSLSTVAAEFTAIPSGPGQVVGGVSNESLLIAAAIVVAGVVIGLALRRRSR